MSRKQQDDPKAEMTPMIDVVFQLMIFFIVTIKQEDIFSKLNANAPSPNSSSQPTEEKDTPISIQIGLDPTGRDVVLFKDRPVDIKELDSIVKGLARDSADAQVVVRCALNSHHGELVRVLDIFHRYKMKNLAILSM